MIARYVASNVIPFRGTGIENIMSKLNRIFPSWLAVMLALSSMSVGNGVVNAATTLSDVPVYSSSSVPANLMLALSVEFPTGVTLAYGASTPFVKTNPYLGYFDNTRCYTYQSSTTVPLDNYFIAAGTASAAGTCSDATQWSGNFLNWASMTALDEFRQTLTGGNRIIDQPGLTVLQRSRETGQGGDANAPNKSITSPLGVVPLPYSLAATVYIRSQASGGELTLGTDRGIFIDVADNSGYVNNLLQHSVRYYVRVKVCEAAGNNCTAYSGGYKPEGLIQQNANRIRVGAAGYLNRNGNDHPNGVIRSLIRDVGPTKYNGLAARTANPYQEWDSSTGVFVTSPDAASAASSAVSNSGAINYLNKFGTTQSYMTYDTISELYWAALAYYMQVPLDASYTIGTTPGSAPYDNFPVISTTANDPVEYSCQGSSIVVIGDSHTWCDSRTPGGGPNSNGSNGCSNQTPLPAVNGLNAVSSLNTLGALPLLEPNSGNPYSTTAAVYLPGGYRTGLGSQQAATGAGAATYDIAGMAYFAHTKDIRPDITDPTAPKQTVDTFAVDVMETGAADNTTAGKATFDPLHCFGSCGPNQYWLAAKYGGFNDVNDDGIPANYLTWHTNTTTGLNTRPDNLFPGNRPDLIQSGLATIFNRVASKTILSSVGPGTSSTRSLKPVDTTVYKTSAAGFSVYTTNYKPGDWTGDILGSVSVVNADGTVSPVTLPGPMPQQQVQWSAQSRLDSMTQVLDSSNNPTGWSTTRRVITRGSSGGIPFRYASLTSAQKTALNSDTTLVDFLRGDRSKEGITYRSRRSVLGDIVNSEATLVQGALSSSYSDAANPGYSTFMATLASRAPVVYVGANDGMMHAFAADFSAPTPLGTGPASVVAGGGSELFAYVPSFMFNGPTLLTATPNVTGLAALGNLAGVSAQPFAHHFYVDQTPQVSDVDFNRTGSNPTGAGVPDWHTLLVGALGKGGRGIYALDVTTVAAPLAAGTSAAQETTIAAKSLWEFTDSDMGYVYGKPVMAKTRKYGWVVLVTSGYNNASGKGKLYVINAKTGSLLETFVTTAGTAANPSGLGRASAYTQDATDNTIEQVYAGDLMGNVWRFDLSSASGSPYPAPVVLATLTAPDGTPQPVTTAPRIETDVDLTGLSTRRWIFVGTGQFLDVGDLTTTQTQSMYALRDGTVELPSCAGPVALPNVCVANPNSLPLTRSGLIQLSNLLTTITIPDAAEGWYYDLPGQAGNAAERVVVDPDSQAGVPIIAWATLIPTNDPCSYHGAIYAVNYATGKSALLDAGGNTIGSVSPPGGAPTKVSIVQLPDGSLGLLYGSLGGTPSLQNLDAQALIAPLSRTNWREILN